MFIKIGLVSYKHKKLIFFPSSKLKLMSMNSDASNMSSFRVEKNIRVIFSSGVETFMCFSLILLPDRRKKMFLYFLSFAIPRREKFMANSKFISWLLSQCREEKQIVKEK